MLNFKYKTLTINTLTTLSNKKADYWTKRESEIQVYRLFH